LSQVCAALSARLGDVGFNRFAYWLIWPPDRTKKPFCLTNYAKEWSERYFKENYARHDYVGRYAATSVVPFIWSDAAKKIILTRQQNTIFDEGKSAGLKNGGTVPIHGPGAAKATLSVANDLPYLEFFVLFTRWRHEIHLMATYVHEKIMSFDLSEPLDLKLSLTQRETEILTWVAHGKSYWETGRILNISEETIKDHLKSTRAKLGASNTTHAIAIALMHGLIRP
jgi:DNA-binding CsgD family transcriptional regulator